MSRCSVLAILFLVVSVSDFGEGARILAVCPTVSISHQVVIRGLALALNKRGHELVVVTSDPINDPNLKNYTEIDMNFLYDTNADFNFIANRGTQQWIELASTLQPVFNRQTEIIFNHPEFKKLYASSSNEKFDLVILEMFVFQAFLPLGIRFNAPIVGVSSLGLLPNTHYVMGNPIFPSHPSHWELRTEVPGSIVLWQRLQNFVKTWKNIYSLESNFVLKQEAFAKKYFGNDIPSLSELQRNVSLIFVSQQLPISFARPNLPNIIEINSFHTLKQPEPLPMNLQKILDGATQGFVYMSLGSNVKSRMFSPKQRSEIVAAFSKLPYKVIWKFEDDSLSEIPDNVLIMKWTPQTAILAHPNIKVFIYQGGLQSTEEAIAHAVPVIGFPVFGDQDMQVNKMVSIGVAKKLEISTVNQNDLIEAINAVATDTSFKQNMLNLRSLMKDRPHDLLNNAVWWTEHVIRHRGAPYLRSSFADEPWYQRQDMDVIAFLSAGFVIVFGLTVAILYKLFVFARQLSSKKMKVM